MQEGKNSLKLSGRTHKGDIENTGFSERVSDQAKRLLNRNGSFNIEKRGLPWYKSLNLYHSLIFMPWWKFLLFVMGCYVGINFVFAMIYDLLGPSHFGGMIFSNETERFLECFFFSTQTFTTVGYGRINPVGILSNAVASFSGMCGLLFFALSTSLMYARFSRPSAEIEFSRDSVLAPYRENQTAWMFRMINKRESMFIQAEAHINFSLVIMERGVPTRRYFPLKLEINKVNYLVLNWTVVHPIDSDSPLYNLSHDDLIKGSAEFLVQIKGYDSTFAQEIYSTTSYRYDEVVWGAKFVPMYSQSPDGYNTYLDVEKLNKWEKVDLPVAG